MKTDRLFYKVFRRWPALALGLAGLDPAAAPRDVFRAEEIKQTAFRLDGLLAPAEESDESEAAVARARRLLAGGAVAHPGADHLAATEANAPRVAETLDLLNLTGTILVYK